jgi:hypothetical protein
MKNPKKIAIVQVIAGLLMTVSGLHNLNYFAEGALDHIGIQEILSFIQLIGGPAFLILAVKTWKTKS